MPPNESLYPGDWLAIAEKDWKRVETLLKADDPDASGFYLQQAVEKFLKAFLLCKKWKLKRIHDLETLLNEALLHEPTLGKFRSECQKISGYYFMDRYPLILGDTLTQKDVEESQKAIKDLVVFLRANIQNHITQFGKPNPD